MFLVIKMYRRYVLVCAWISEEGRGRKEKNKEMGLLSLSVKRMK